MLSFYFVVAGIFRFMVAGVQRIAFLLSHQQHAVLLILSIIFVLHRNNVPRKDNLLAHLIFLFRFQINIFVILNIPFFENMIIMTILLTRIFLPIKRSIQPLIHLLQLIISNMISYFSNLRTIILTIITKLPILLNRTWQFNRSISICTILSL